MENNGSGEKQDRQEEEEYCNKSSEIVAACELPTSKEVDTTYTIARGINLEDNWILGKIDNTHLSLNYFLKLESNQYRLSVNDNSYRLIVNQYDVNNQSIGNVDLCNGDILNIGTKVSYITITIYKYLNGQRVNHSYQDILRDLENGLKYTITKIENLEEHITDKELLSAEHHMGSFSNYYNYRTGWYKSWGGSYEKISGSLCTRNLYRIDDKIYQFNVNDSRISLSLTEYDVNGKWIKYTGELKNGSTFKKQPTTFYIGLSIKSRKWGVDLFSLFENGLRMELSKEQYIHNTRTISFDDAALWNADYWKVGAYLFETGEFIIDPNKIRYDSYCRIDSKDYVVRLPGGYLKMSILELDKSGKVVMSYELQSGQKWRKSENTDRIAITVLGNNKTFQLDEYRNMIKGYPSFGLEEYIKYEHNTVMKNISAGELINTVNVGWNLGNSLDSTSSTMMSPMQELNWGNPYITKDLIDYVAQCGFNTIRIPVTWYYNSYRAEGGDLKIYEEWLKRVQEVIDYAISNQMYVILNSHHDQKIIYAGINDTTMHQVLSDASTLWKIIAEHFKTYDEHLIFEAYNEVDNIEKSWNYSDKAAAQMNELNQTFVDTVRSTGNNNAKRILIVPTLLDGDDSRILSAFIKPKDIVADKIIVELHTYSMKFIQDIESDFAVMEEFSQRIKAPILIGEFGSTITYPLPELRAEHASNFVARAAEHGIKCVWWDNGSNYKIIDRRDFSASNYELINALMDGSRGIGYQLEQLSLLNKPEQFAYYTPNMKTGKLENTHWGTLTTDLDGGALKLQGGPICSISLKAVDGAAGVWLQRILFYDTAGVLVQQGKEILAQYYIGSIPERSATARVSFNSPSVNISLDNYQSYLNNGDIELRVGFFGPKDVKRIQLTKKQYTV